MDVDSFLDDAFDADNFLSASLSSNFEDVAGVGGNPDYLGASALDTDESFLPQFDEPESPLHLRSSRPSFGSLRDLSNPFPKQRHKSQPRQQQQQQQQPAVSQRFTYRAQPDFVLEASSTDQQNDGLKRVKCEPGKLGISLAYDPQTRSASIGHVVQVPSQRELARLAHRGDALLRINNWDAVGRTSQQISAKISALQIDGGVIVLRSAQMAPRSDTFNFNPTTGMPLAPFNSPSNPGEAQSMAPRLQHQRVRQHLATQPQDVSGGVMGDARGTPSGIAPLVPGTALHSDVQAALKYQISAVVPDPAKEESAMKKKGGAPRISRKVYNKKRLREISDYIDKLRRIATPYGYQLQCKRDVLKATISLVTQLQQQNALLYDALSSVTASSTSNTAGERSVSPRVSSDVSSAQMPLQPLAVPDMGVPPAATARRPQKRRPSAPSTDGRPLSAGDPVSPPKRNKSSTPRNSEWDKKQ